MTVNSSALKTSKCCLDSIQRRYSICCSSCCLVPIVSACPPSPPHEGPVSGASLVEAFPLKVLKKRFGGKLSAAALKQLCAHLVGAFTACWRALITILKLLARYSTSNKNTVPYSLQQIFEFLFKWENCVFYIYLRFQGFKTFIKTLGHLSEKQAAKRVHASNTFCSGIPFHLWHEVKRAGCSNHIIW